MAALMRHFHSTKMFNPMIGFKAVNSLRHAVIILSHYSGPQVTAVAGRAVVDAWQYKRTPAQDH
jgi:hypothetical protein